PCCARAAGLAGRAPAAPAPLCEPAHQGKSLSAWVKELAQPDPARRAAAAAALGSIGPKAQSAVGPLVVALRDPDARLRSAAACALGQIGPGAAGAVSSLMRALKDSQRGVRYYAGNALAQIR